MSWIALHGRIRKRQGFDILMFMPAYTYVKTVLTNAEAPNAYAYTCVASVDQELQINSECNILFCLSRIHQSLISMDDLGLSKP